jgi:hypothetical protein
MKPFAGSEPWFPAHAQLALLMSKSMFQQFTLGIEEEFQIVDPHTRELRSHVSEILAEGKTLLGEQVKPELGRAGQQAS